MAATRFGKRTLLALTPVLAISCGGGTTGALHASPVRAAAAGRSKGSRKRRGAREPLLGQGTRRKDLIRLRRVDVHLAARFVADATGTGVIVVGGDGALRDADLPLGDGPAALRALARVYGMRAVERGSMTLILPAGAELGANALPSSPNARLVNLDLLGVKADKLVDLLSKVIGVKADGTVRGSITIVARGVSGFEALGAALAACGAKVAASKRQVMIWPGSALCRRTPLLPWKGCGIARRGMRTLRRACTPSAELTLRATAAGGRPPARALLTGRRAGAPLVLMRGDALVTSDAKALWTVESIESRHVDLAQGNRRLRLSLPARGHAPLPVPVTVGGAPASPR